MPDRISLVFSNDGKSWKQVSHFLSYQIEADLYTADHAFSMELANPEIEIKPGQLCRLYVNDQLELTGIIDRRVRRTDKGGRKLTIEGRDLMGLVVDSYAEEFITVEGMKLSQLAGRLLKDVPFINRKSILYQQDKVGKFKTRRSRDAAFGLQAIMGMDVGERIAQIRPGMSKFQVLQIYALSQGLMFYSLPDGTFVFGRPLAGGPPDYTIVFNRDGKGNNVLWGEVEENLSKSYSKVTVIAQRQGHVDDGMDTGALNLPPGIAYNQGFPFYKPFVQLSHNDSQTPTQHARLLLEKMRHDGFSLSYELKDHSPDGANNYTINRMIQVQDDVHGVHGAYLVYGRTLKLDKDNGPTTVLRLGPPGLVEDSGLQKGHK